MDEAHAAGRRLVALVQSYRGIPDRADLARQLSENWSADCLCLLLTSADDEIAAAAAESLGLVGDSASARPIASLLHHADKDVVHAAEQGLWSIWFREGGPLACEILTRIARTIENHEVENAIPLLTELIRSQPTFAEAFHQRSQVYYLTGDYARCLQDAKRAFRLNPLHFAALANQGHSQVAVGRLTDALQTYHAVLRIHPRWPAIREHIRALRGRAASIAHA